MVIKSLQRTKLTFTKLGTILLVGYVVIFYALPLGFFAFKPSQQLKSKPIADAGYEFSVGYDFENETQPNAGQTHFATLTFSDLSIISSWSSAAKRKFQLKKRQGASLYSLNCSFIFYG